MSCIEMSRELSEGIRGQIIALSNEGMSQRKIADKVSQKVLWSGHCRGLRNRILFHRTKIWQTKGYHSARG